MVTFKKINFTLKPVEPQMTFLQVLKVLNDQALLCHLKIMWQVTRDIGQIHSAWPLYTVSHVCQPSSGNQLVSIAATPKLHVKRLKKEGLVRELQQRRLSVQGSVQVLRERLCTFLKNLEQSYLDRNVDLAKVHFSQNIKPSSIAKASDSIFSCAAMWRKPLILHDHFGAEWSGSWGKCRLFL